MLLEVFMPFYGDVNLFKTAVFSIVNQTDPAWKLTIIDDVYPSDEPARFIRELEDSRIRYLRNETNLGVSGNFQRCVDLAQADFVTIVGCDDILLPNYVARMKEIINANPHVSYIQPGVSVIDEIGREYLPVGDRVKRRMRDKFHPPSTQHGENVVASLLQGCWTYFPSICWRTTELTKFGFRRDYDIVLDLALQLEILTSGGTLFVDNLPSFGYRRHRHSVSMQGAINGSRFQEEAQLFAEFSQRTQLLGWTKAHRAARLHLTSRSNALLQAPKVVLQGQFKTASQLMKHALTPNS